MLNRMDIGPLLMFASGFGGVVTVLLWELGYINDAADVVQLKVYGTSTLLGTLVVVLTNK
jgi:hypothetical protein